MLGKQILDIGCAECNPIVSPDGIACRLLMAASRIRALPAIRDIQIIGRNAKRPQHLQNGWWGRLIKVEPVDDVQDDHSADDVRGYAEPDVPF
ncbi:hypothetical protein [Primorskyibacter marinus]|uniref:hypothetical protein n=1 Tax=Primorskyibacter marinus TaxID=1977320 RepID=UPI000E30A72F|nr:hypothetical protein [Primorskyibacter marinus]